MDSNRACCHCRQTVAERYEPVLPIETPYVYNSVLRAWERYPLSLTRWLHSFWVRSDTNGAVVPVAGRGA